MALLDEPFLLSYIDYLVASEDLNDVVTGLLVTDQDFRSDELFQLVLRHVGDRVPKLNVRLLGVRWVLDLD